MTSSFLHEIELEFEMIDDKDIKQHDQSAKDDEISTIRNDGIKEVGTSISSIEISKNARDLGMDMLKAPNRCSVIEQGGKRYIVTKINDS